MIVQDLPLHVQRVARVRDEERRAFCLYERSLQLPLLHGKYQIYLTHPHGNI